MVALSFLVLKFLNVKFLRQKCSFYKGRFIKNVLKNPRRGVEVDPKAYIKLNSFFDKLTTNKK